MLKTRKIVLQIPRVITMIWSEAIPEWSEFLNVHIRPCIFMISNSRLHLLVLLIRLLNSVYTILFLVRILCRACTWCVFERTLSPPMLRMTDICTRVRLPSPLPIRRGASQRREPCKQTKHAAGGSCSFRQNKGIKSARDALSGHEKAC